MGWKNEMRLYRLLRKAQRALKDAVVLYDKCIVHLDVEPDERLTLKEIKERLEALERQATRAEGEVKGIQGRLDDARAAVERAEAAQQVVQETEAGHGSQQ